MGRATAPEQELPPQPMGCTTSELLKGMASDRRRCHLKKEKRDLSLLTPTFCLSGTTLHGGEGKREKTPPRRGKEH